MDAVITAEKMRAACIFRDAEGLFQRGAGDRKRLNKENSVRYESVCFEIEGCEKTLRVKIQETIQGQKESHFIWLVTTLEDTPPQLLMGNDAQALWDLRRNAFTSIKLLSLLTIVTFTAPFEVISVNADCFPICGSWISIAALKDIPKTQEEHIEKRYQAFLRTTFYSERCVTQLLYDDSG